MATPRASTKHQKRTKGPRVTYHAVMLPSGACLPIEVRVGARVIQRVAADSAQGRELLRSGLVDIFKVDS
jgi:hypothetical protein